MSRLDELPPDQKAVLSLLLRQRKRYTEVAGMLGIQEKTVHDRAHAALAVLAPHQARQLPTERREQVGDYLLGQQAPSRQPGTQAYLQSSAPARVWARAIGSELEPLAAGALPQIPRDERNPAGRGQASLLTGQLSDQERAAIPAEGGSSSPPASSRLAGALLLAAIVVAVVVAVVVIVAIGGKAARTATPHITTTNTTQATGAAKLHVDKRIRLTPTDRARRAAGIAEVVSQGSQRAFYTAAEGLPPSKGFSYAVWLYNSQTSAEALGKAPSVGSNGILQGGGLLPANAASYHRLVVTREVSNNPSQPGPILLSGPFALH